MGCKSNTLYYFPTPSLTDVVDFVGHKTTPLHLELVTFDKVTKETILGTFWGVMRETNTTTVVVFVSLAPATAASACLDAGDTRATMAWRTGETMFLCGTLIYIDGLCLIVVPGSHGSHLLH